MLTRPIVDVVVASGTFVALGTSSYRVPSMLFGDFNGDGRTDILRPDGTRFNVAWGATGAWQTLAVSDEARDEIALGDFDGDGKTDVFRTGCH